MKKEYKIDKNLYKQLKSHLLFNYKKNSQDYNDIMIKIPNSARIKVSDVYEEVSRSQVP